MTTTKKIIQRNLPLNVKYTLIDKKYISILDGGCVCENCFKPISNIATVKSEIGMYNVGFDCMETFLLNNNLLEGFDIENYTAYKRSLPAMIKNAKLVKDSIVKDKNIEFDVTDFQRWFNIGSSKTAYLYFGAKNCKTKDWLKINKTTNLNDLFNIVESICNVTITTI